MQYVSCALQAIRQSHNFPFQALNSFINQALKGVNQNHNRELLEKYQAVTKDEVLAALKKYCLRVFNPATSVAVIVTAPGKVDSTMAGFQNLGFVPERRELEVSPEEMEGLSDEEMSDEEMGEDEDDDSRRG